MRFRIIVSLFSNQKRLVIVICIVIIIIIAILGTSAILDTSSSSDVNAMILVDKEILRVDEPITFDARNSSGDIMMYVWDFGDGNESIEVQPTHQYEQPGWYNVTLLVVGKNGDNDSALVYIGIQYEDVVISRILNRMFQIRGEASSTYMIHIGPNAGAPTLNIDITLDAVVGNFFVVVRVFSNVFDTRLYYEDLTGTGSRYTNSLTIAPEDIPDEAAFTDSWIYFEIGIDEGYWSGGSIGFQCIFPIEDLSPPTT